MNVDKFFDGAFLVRSRGVFDNRGSFSNIWCKNELKQFGIEISVDQINLSNSLNPGTLRGLHYQINPSTQAKVITCCQGSIYDVIVDMREDSSTYLKWKGVYMEEHSPSILIIPPVFAQGFLTLEKNTSILYLNKGFYDPSCERGIRYNDPKLGITWPGAITNISDKDQKWSNLI